MIIQTEDHNPNGSVDRGLERPAIEAGGVSLQVEARTRK
jgi:hypothetical protein